LHYIIMKIKMYLEEKEKESININIR
jgi:hypothetical protein